MPALQELAIHHDWRVKNDIICLLPYFAESIVKIFNLGR
jgi:hypothetical protein